MNSKSQPSNDFPGPVYGNVVTVVPFLVVQDRGARSKASQWLEFENTDSILESFKKKSDVCPTSDWLEITTDCLSGLVSQGIPQNGSSCISNIEVIFVPLEHADSQSM